MIKITHKEVSPFGTNCYLVKDEATSEAALVDPGDEAEALMRFINEADVKVKYILATHCHVDHVSAASEMMKKLGLGFMACDKDRFLLETLADTCRMYGLRPSEPPVITRKIEDGDTLPLGKSTLRFHHAPGHSPGSMLIQAGEEDLIVGDVLFAGSIGRTDLPGGSMETLRNSIMNVLVPLGDAMRVYPGHGPATTIGWEKENNMFILEWS
ncbi:MAG: MBL fold metallo-hydrolase [Planctomycetota bacterium]